MRERAAVAHVLRRLSMGPQPDLAATLEGLRRRDRSGSRPERAGRDPARDRASARLRSGSGARRAGAADHVLAPADAVEPAAHRGTARVVLARPLRDQRGEGAHSLPDVAAAPAATATRHRQLRRAAARGVEGSRDALVPRRRLQHRARGERELRARSDGAVHDRSWELHGAGRDRGVPSVHRLGGEHPRHSPIGFAQRSDPTVDCDVPRHASRQRHESAARHHRQPRPRRRARRTAEPRSHGNPDRGEALHGARRRRAIGQDSQATRQDVP